ncbi:MAG: 16S rRNA (guanine(527)-N(7))-methyltransferase RsmG [Burkholderiales bacterium]
MTPAVALERGVNDLGIVIAAKACERLLDYLALLAKWNGTYNLTAIRDPLAMVSHHLLDSLAVLPHLPLSASARVADAASGAGLPGIPLALARPQWHVALIDSNAKKCAFLRQAAIELGLENVEVHEGRVEVWQPPTGFALVISRAFARLAQFVDACRHLVAPGGLLAAMKGKEPREEIAELPADVHCKAVIAVRTPFVDAERHLVVCELRA